MEKGDAEHLALVRQRHDMHLQQMAQGVRFRQWKQAQETTESLLHSRASALERYRYYQRILGLSADTTDVPDALGIDRRELTEGNFDEAYAALVEQYARAVPEHDYPTLRRAPESASNLIALTLQTGTLHLNLDESLDLNVLGPAALVLRALSATTETPATALAAVPDAYVDLQYWGVGGHAQITGGPSSPTPEGPPQGRSPSWRSSTKTCTCGCRARSRVSITSTTESPSTPRARPSAP